MKRLNSLVVTQTRILRADDLPFVTLLTQSAIAQIQKAFNFRQAMPMQPPLVPDPAGGIGFWGGEIEINSIPVTIQQVIIEPRKVTTVVAAPSDSSQKAYSMLTDLIRRLDSREPKPDLDPIVLTQETATVLELDFPITRLFEDGRIATFAKEIDSLSDRITPRVSIVPSGVTFRVSYLEPSDKLKANNVQLIDKDLKIELRMSTSIEENLFFISSPNSSDTHMKLIARLEEVFSQTSRKEN